LSAQQKYGPVECEDRLKNSAAGMLADIKNVYNHLGEHNIFRMMKFLLSTGTIHKGKKKCNKCFCLQKKIKKNRSRPEN